MIKNFLKVICKLFLTLFLLSVVLFLLFSLLPGDPALAVLGPNALPEQVNHLRETLGLNDPFYLRYLKSLLGIFSSDLGAVSWQFQIPVYQLLGERSFATFSLVIYATLILLVLSVPLAICSIRYPQGFFDRLINLIAQFMMSLPTFFSAIVLTLVFGYLLKFFQPGPPPKPDSGWPYWNYLFYPALALALPRVAQAFLFLRNSLLQELQGDYVILARSKGLSFWGIVFKHTLKNALPPFITSMSLIVATLFTGNLVVEQVFSINGLGKLLFSAISHRDFPVVQAVLLLAAGVIITINACSDILNYHLDKRLAFTGSILIEEQEDKGKGRSRNKDDKK